MPVPVPVPVPVPDVSGRHGPPLQLSSVDGVHAMMQRPEPVSRGARLSTLLALAPWWSIACGGATTPGVAPAAVHAPQAPVATPPARALTAVDLGPAWTEMECAPGAAERRLAAACATPGVSGPACAPLTIDGEGAWARWRLADDRRAGGDALGAVALEVDLTTTLNADDVARAPWRVGQDRLVRTWRDAAAAPACRQRLRAWLDDTHQHACHLDSPVRFGPIGPACQALAAARCAVRAADAADLPPPERAAVLTELAFAPERGCVGTAALAASAVQATLDAGDRAGAEALRARAQREFPPTPILACYPCEPRRPRLPPVPRLNLTALTVGPGLDREVVGRAVRRDLGAMNACAQRRQATRPDLHGTLALTFTVEADGRVRDAAGRGLDASVALCVATRARTLQLPARVGGAPVAVEVTLTLPAAP